MSALPVKPPHVALFHVHALGGICPICHVSQATSWPDLIERLDDAKKIAEQTLEVESDFVLSKIKVVARVGKS